VKASEELLAMREKAAEAPWRRWRLMKDLDAGGIGSAAYLRIWHQKPWPRQWIEDPDRTHLEVVEMIERAAVAAMKAGE
jgi:hypothetical protein